MNDKIIILSDIHGNLSALHAVMDDFENKGYKSEAIAILGDSINYGMRPNEVINELVNIAYHHNVIANIIGNHEKAIFDGETSHFSTERGKRALALTRSMLSEESFNYLNRLTHEGMIEHEISGKRILFVHGDITDPYWGKLDYSTIDDERYAKYDYVISGHSHMPHLIEKFYNSDLPELRNKKRTIFLNPGSVGQPRNHNPKAQYLYLDIHEEIFHFNAVEYDVEYERSLYPDNIDPFYKNRLIKGI